MEGGRALAGRAPLIGSKGQVRAYHHQPADARGAPLNKHHTHFIFVDDTKRTSDDAPAWGKEVAVRSAVEDVFANSLNVPLLLIVVDGGIGTLDTVYHFASQAVKKPIVVVYDSGRAAAAIYDYCTHGEIDELEATFRTPRALEQARQPLAYNGV